MEPVAGVLDTSAIVARHQEDASIVLPDQAAISTVTLVELHAGVRGAANEHARRVRQRQLSFVEARFEPLPVDEDVARHAGRIRADARRAGHKAALADVLIAATAVAQGVAVYTRDRDFERLSGVDVVIV